MANPRGYECIVSGRSIAHSATRCHDSFGESEVVSCPVAERLHFELSACQFASGTRPAEKLHHSAGNGWQYNGKMRSPRMPFPVSTSAVLRCRYSSRTVVEF
jgi:hypothetical protein